MSFIYPHLSVDNFVEAIKYVHDDLIREGYVAENFADMVIEREKSFPTGLDAGAIKVAIPHTEAEYVFKPTIAVITLDKPIEMCNMDLSGTKLDVDILFLLVVSDPKAQVETLRHIIINVIQDEQLLKKLKEANTKDEILDLLKDKIQM